VDAVSLKAGGMEGSNTAPWVRKNDTAWDVHAICLYKLNASSPFPFHFGDVVQQATYTYKIMVFT